MSKLIEHQKKLLKNLQNSENITEAMYAKYKLKDLQEKPMFSPIYASDKQDPVLEDHNLNTRMMYLDITTLHDSISDLANEITETFNSNVNDLKTMSSELSRLTSIVTNLSLLSAENEHNVVYFKDSFVNKDYIEPSTGLQSDILTNEGIAVLHINDAKDFKLKVVDIRGNGSPGNYQLVKESPIKNRFLPDIQYLSETNAQDDPRAIVDDNPHTWYEYQSLSIENPEKLYDADWVKNQDTLRVKITLSLEEPATLNWISILPYYPEKSRRRLKVRSVKTSSDGINYYPIGKEVILNEEINITPQTYLADNAFASSLQSKGVGVWNFPAREVKFIEVVLDQEESYTEDLGHTYYEKGSRDSDSTAIVPLKEVPSNIQRGYFGRYNIQGGYITKGILPLEGERLCIGLRDISAYGYTFEEESEIVSTQFVSHEPITSISLLVNEQIPEDFLDDLNTRNEWIKYYVSIDDITWHRISPMHHRPFHSEEDFPPKLITINSPETDEKETLNVLNIDTEKDCYTVRFKAVFSRPEGEEFEMMTPVLQDYAIRCTTL